MSSISRPRRSETEEALFKSALLLRLDGLRSSTAIFEGFFDAFHGCFSVVYFFLSHDFIKTATAFNLNGGLYTSDGTSYSAEINGGPIGFSTSMAQIMQ